MTITFTEDDLQHRTAREFLALADVLDAVTPSQWDTPSLCTGWRVREVIAHLTMPARYGPEQFMAELAAFSFDFGRLSDTVAARDAALPTCELIADLRSETMQRWTPPEGGQRGALNHVVVHGLDVTVPLAAPRRDDAETLRVVLEDLTAGGAHAHFGTVIDGRRLEATDLDWSHGSGAALRGTRPSTGAGAVRTDDPDSQFVDDVA
jgi:uncharacterized protein (TIGR03083 family)